MKKVICSCCILLINAVGMCIPADDPIFQYRCAEHAYQAGDYPVARRFYEAILSCCHNSSHLELKSVTGILDTMLAVGDWFSADEFINRYDFAIFQKIFGYDSLLLRECFLLVKNRHFQFAQDLLLSIDFLELDREYLGWYHCLYALVLSHYKNFHEAAVEFDLACGFCTNIQQLAVVEAMKSQCEVGNIGADSNVDHILDFLREKIACYKYTSLSVPFFKQYLLLSANFKRNDSIVNELMQMLTTNLISAEEVYELLVYHAFYVGLVSQQGLSNLETVLLNSANRRSALLALKFITNAILKEDEIKIILKFLDTIFQKIESEWLRRYILLAEMAVAITNNEFLVCRDIASQYINTFEKDKIFDEIYALLAYLAVEENANEYRSSVNYLDKLRASTEDINTKLAITLKIADAFFYNQDFKVAAEIYSEVLSLDKSKKFQDIIENQIISDIFLQNFDQAKQHLSEIEYYSPAKCIATFYYIEALKGNELFIEALDYINSINKQSLPKKNKFKLLLYKAQILFVKKKYAQSMIIASKIFDAYSGTDFLNSEEIGDLVSHSLFIKGCCALKLSDLPGAVQAFEFLRTHFKHNKYVFLSYIKESKHVRKKGDLQKALILLNRCDDETYMPYIKYEIAGILCLEGKMKEALNMLETVIQYDVHSDLSTLAKLAQGDVLRMLGEFSDANIIYERILSTVEGDDFIRYATLARVKCLLAQVNRKATCLDRAIIELEKLYAAQDVDLAWHMEVAAEYCLALQLKNNFGRLQDLALSAIRPLSECKTELSENTIFWTLQILFLLQNSLLETEFDQCSLEYVTDMIKKYRGMLKND